MMKNHSLTHHFLAATPQIKDATFAGSLIYMLEHDEQGASGIIVNRPLELQLSVLFQTAATQTASNEDTKSPMHHSTVYFGGPLAGNHGFVLHLDNQQRWENTIVIAQDIALTTSRDIIDDILRNQGPEKNLIALGYAGWDSRQLEREMLENAWVAIPASSAIIFDIACELRFEQANKALGIDISLLTPQSGHA